MSYDLCVQYIVHSLVLAFEFALHIFVAEGRAVYAFAAQFLCKCYAYADDS